MGCGASSPPENTKLVIVGCGFGGSALAALADSQYDVTLVEKRALFVHKIGLPRGVVDAKFASQLLLPMDNILARGDVKQGTVTQVGAKHVTLSDGSQVPFDYLVLAVGGRNGFVEPSAEQEGTKEGMNAYYTALSGSVKKSTHVAIIGAGPTGVELAGEMRDAFPDKKITLIQSAKGVCPGQKGSPTPQAFQDKMAKALAAKKIDVKLGVRGDLSDIKMGALGYHEGMVDLKLSDASTLACDLILPCMGFKPAGREIKGLPVDAKGFIKINQYFQVEGYNNVFAIGDCSNSSQLKMAAMAGSTKGTPMPAGQADLVLANLTATALEKKQLPNKIDSKAPDAIMIVPVGHKEGAAVGIPWLMQGMVMGKKRADYFLGDQRKKLNVKAQA